MYQVETDLSLSDQGWRKIKIKNCGFTNSGALHYNVVDQKTEEKIIKIYIYPSVKTVKAFQGRHRKVTFTWSDGIDGNSANFIIQKIINFLMW